MERASALTWGKPDGCENRDVKRAWLTHAKRCALNTRRSAPIQKKRTSNQAWVAPYFTEVSANFESLPTGSEYILRHDFCFMSFDSTTSHLSWKTPHANKTPLSCLPYDFWGSEAGSTVQSCNRERWFCLYYRANAGYAQCAWPTARGHQIPNDQRDGKPSLGARRIGLEL